VPFPVRPTPTPAPHGVGELAEDELSGTGTARADRDNLGWFARVSLFMREVIAELRKVIWPTRKELIAYTGVVIVFVLIMAGIVALMDFVFGRGVLALFGGE
jgi:preprotein translocase subunit SecE